MKKCIVVLLLFCAYALAQNMIVRVYASSWDDLRKISRKRDLDIAGAHGGEWYDIVADQAVFNKIVNSGLSYEVVVHDLAAAKEAARASYISYEETNDSLQQMVANYPSIAKLDSLPITSYEGRWIYGIKISDNPDLEEDDEPGFLIEGTHHSREWACPLMVLFFADSILSAYGTVSQITDIINTTEIYCFPIINVDGYVYDYPSGYSWRKNREPFHGSIGTDPNRNYAGCAPDIEGDWGAVDEGQASHWPSNILFCGAYANSGDETRALTMYVKEHTCNAYMTYHSYAEKLCWNWGWTNAPAPDAALLERVGDTMASMIDRLGSGHYISGPIYSAIYPVSGSSMDWLYSWSHWVAGIRNLSYTTELGTSFYQPQGDLDHILHENFDALLYLADFCDSILVLTTGVVAPPEIYPLDTVGTDFVLHWHPVNSAENDPLYWELVESSDPTVIEDDLESGTGQWLLDGFALSTTRAHSGTYSYFSGNVDDMNHAVRTAQPYLVQPGDSVTFWCWYDLEYDYDVAVVEVSENTKLWFNLDTTRFSGTQTSWQRQAYSLEDWVGKSVYIRFRSMTDSYVLNTGFYVDDIYPVVQFSNVDTIASTVSDTSYAFTGHAEGNYYCYVRGYNNDWAWGDYSCLEDVSVIANTPPESPYIYCAKSGSDIKIAWSPVTTDTLGSPVIISHYAVYRDTLPNFNVTIADSIGYAVAPDTDYVDAGALLGTDSYYYLIMAVDAAGNKSRKSNMGYAFRKTVNANPAATSKNWLGLPWHSNYSTVSDMTDDLSPSGDPLIKITSLRDDQLYESYTWNDVFSMWLGADFAITPGRAYEVVTIVDTFLVLVGSNNPDGLIYLYENPAKTDKNWVFLPYNAVYSTISDVTTEYAPAGNPLTKCTNLRDDQLFESYTWNAIFSMWLGTDFAIERGRGYEFTTIVDTTWNPTEYSNTAKAGVVRRVSDIRHIDMKVGTSTESARKPAWQMANGQWQIAKSILPMANGKDADMRELHDAETRELHKACSVERNASGIEHRAVSHIVRVHVGMEGYDDLVFTAFGPERPYDVLTENVIGSSVACEDNIGAVWFDVGNFKSPWQDGDELIVIIEATRNGGGYYAVIDCTLDGDVDIQELGKTELVLIPHRQEHVIGYSLYKNGERLNNDVLSSYKTGNDIAVRAVIRGGYETVYSSSGVQSDRREAPVSYAFGIMPNPFIKQTSIDYALPERTMVAMVLYDVTGRQIVELASGVQNAGYYTAVWNGTDALGRRVASGVYFVKMTAGDFVAQDKILLVK